MPSRSRGDTAHAPIALPCGLNIDGMPVSLQIAGHHLSEPLLVQIGDAFESASDFHNLHPAI